MYASLSKEIDKGWNKHLSERPASLILVCNSLSIKPVINKGEDEMVGRL
jgi:hypothetical protein